MSVGRLSAAAEASWPPDTHHGRMSLGRTPFFACQADPRFAYCLYVPKGIASADRRPLLVVVHGDRRTAEKYRDALAGFGETHGCVVLAPLFPVGVPAPDSTFGYRRLRQGDVRFDVVLLRMVEEAAARWPVDVERFYLHGFSGGAQFALRFFYLHSERLAGLSVCAPGNITRLDTSLPWPAGIIDVADTFGVTPRLDVLRSVPVHLTVGAQDSKPRRDPSRATRLALTTLLYEHLLERGLTATLEVVPDVAHDGFATLPAATRFLSSLIPRDARNRPGP
ncbi:alpha/beta hydrolase [Kitasatospora sp. McL0602]|uniref:alpha/beta hydrolase n=1 Tax=Kitasatospora sp. McL0602 TaxID=3439530 RepID=UPI003F8C866F